MQILNLTSLAIYMAFDVYVDWTLDLLYHPIPVF